jgi:hypothetical protein
LSIELTNLKDYLSLRLNPSLNSLAQSNLHDKKKSLLEIDVEAFLKVLGIPFKQQVTVNNFNVDFVVEPTIEG